MKRVLWGQTVTYHKLKTPDGVLLGGVRAALQHMIRSNYLETDVEIMRSAMLKNKWNSDKGLPLNWFYKKEMSY